jgi:hypothetical protein
MRAGFVLALVLGGAGLALVQKSRTESDADSKALQADLAELPEPLRTEVTKALWTAQASDVPQLQQLAAALQAVGFTKSAARVRQKIEQLGGKPQ